MVVAGVVASVDVDELGAGGVEEVDAVIDGLDVDVAVGVTPALEPAWLASWDARLMNSHATPATTTAASTAAGANHALERVGVGGGGGTGCVTGGGGAATVGGGALWKATVGA